MVPEILAKLHVKPRRWGYVEGWGLFVFRSQGYHWVGSLRAGGAREEVTWWSFLQCWDKVDPDVFWRFCVRTAIHPVELSNQVLTFRLVFSLLYMKTVWSCWSSVALLRSPCWKWSELVGISCFLGNNREDKSTGKDDSRWERMYLTVQDSLGCVASFGYSLRNRYSCHWTGSPDFILDMFPNSFPCTGLCLTSWKADKGIFGIVTFLVDWLTEGNLWKHMEVTVQRSLQEGTFVAAGK